jgi:hypothetical protein
MARRDRIPFSVSDLAKIGVGIGAVAVAWTAVVQVKRIADFILGGEPKPPFNSNDVLLVRMLSQGRFARQNATEYETWQGIIRSKTNDQYVPRIPFTNYFVAKRKGGISFDWRCPVKSETHFCDQVLVKIPLEFPHFTSRKRKEALLGIAQQRAEAVFGSQMKKILVGLQSTGGLPDFDEGSPEEQLASLFSGL